MSRHTCKYFTPAHRNQRRCKYCNRKQWRVDGEWRWSMTLDQFAHNWLPAVSGTNPQDMMRIKVAFPFEWNCYESWNVVFRVRFEFPDVMVRRNYGRPTPVDVMNGWMSKYAQDFVHVDAEARKYFLARTGKPYEIGDNTDPSMRAVIQS